MVISEGKREQVISFAYISVASSEILTSSSLVFYCLIHRRV